MRKRIRKILVTGGAGFIGSAFVRLLAKDKRYKVIVVDKLTYAGDLNRIKEVMKRIKFYQADICDDRKIKAIFAREKPQGVVSFAAETHVDRSIKDPTVFIRTNISGVKVLLDNARKFGIERFVHLSTDEVYGEIEKGEFYENSPIKANSPYSASKAAADLLISSYIRTYSLPAIIVRPCNNYGPWQYPEKLIPLSILKIIKNHKIPVYAKGLNSREWLYVDECAEGVKRILQKGKVGSIYNLGSGEELCNIEVVKLLLSLFKKPTGMLEFVKDRPGHDLRYKLCSKKLFKEIGWRPRIKFKDGIKLTAYWCLTQKDWLLSKWKNIAPLYK